MGYSQTPEYGVRWQPIDPQVTLRATYSNSFTAPTLAAMNGPTDTRLIGTGVILNTFGINNLQFNGEDGNNPNLKPSIAQTKSISATITPNAVEGLTLKGRYSMIDQQGIPAGIGFNNILASVNALGSASPFAGNLAMGNFPGMAGATAFTQPGQVLAYLKNGGAAAAANLYAVDQFRNNSALRIRTLTLSADYVLPTDKWGIYTFDSSATIFNLFKYQALPIQPYYNYAGTATNVEGTLPHYRLYTTLDGQWGPWDVMIANTYIDSLEDIGTGGATASKPYPVKAYTTFDLRVGYSGGRLDFLTNWKLSAGINNIFNRMPPLSPFAYPDNLADVSTYSPLGRTGYIEAWAKF
jgi:iron complex outermembrane receptor protein